MYIKMIFGDIKHTVKDYRIYLLTLILLVGIFYGFLSISTETTRICFIKTNGYKK